MSFYADRRYDSEIKRRKLTVEVCTRMGGSQCGAGQPCNGRREVSCADRTQARGCPRVRVGLTGAGGNLLGRQKCSAFKGDWLHGCVR